MLLVTTNWNATTHWQLSFIDQLCAKHSAVSLCMLSLRFYYIFIYIIFTFCTLLYFSVFHLNYEMDLITISQRGRENVIEDRWCQDHSTNKWEETIDKNIDHMLDQEQRRGKKEQKGEKLKKWFDRVLITPTVYHLCLITI